MECAKLSKGRIEGSAGILQAGEKQGALYLAEGPETGASIAMANPKATVLVSFGVSNLKNLSALIKNYQPTEVVIAGDNDLGAKNNTLKITMNAQEHLQGEGINAKIIIPNKIEGREKTDWNDVHRLKGLQKVKNELGVGQNKDANWVMNAADSIAKKEMKFMNNVDISSPSSHELKNDIGLIEATRTFEIIHQKTRQKGMEYE